MWVSLPWVSAEVTTTGPETGGRTKRTELWRGESPLVPRAPRTQALSSLWPKSPHSTHGLPSWVACTTAPSAPCRTEFVLSYQQAKPGHTPSFFHLCSAAGVWEPGYPRPPGLQELRRPPWSRSPTPRTLWAVPSQLPKAVFFN